LERYPEALVSYQAFLAEAPVGMLTEAQQAVLFSLVEHLKGKISRVRVECNVPGARVLLRGRMVGRTPLPSFVVLNAGDAKLEVIADGYGPYESVLSLPGGALESIVVKLDRVDFRGTLSVRGNVSSADVFVDDALRGRTPMEIKLERGTHVVEVRAQGHKSHRQVVKVEAGKALLVDANLERLPDYTIAYVGFGLGGLGVAAGTGAGILAFSKMSKVEEQCDTLEKECGPAGQSHLQASSTWGTVSNVGFAVGAAGIGLGIYGLLTSKKEAREPDVSLGVNGVLVRGRF
jgi:hypothetical protein